MKYEKFLDKEVRVEWQDSYGVQPGWQPVDDITAGYKQVITSWGRVLKVTDAAVVLAHNYAAETECTLEQANGIMTIPLACIIRINELTSYGQDVG